MVAFSIFSLYIQELFVTRGTIPVLPKSERNPQSLLHVFLCSIRYSHVYLYYMFVLSFYYYKISLLSRVTFCLILL